MHHKTLVHHNMIHDSISACNILYLKCIEIIGTRSYKIISYHHIILYIEVKEIFAVVK